MAYRFDEAAYLERKRSVREESDRLGIIEMDRAPLSEGLCYFYGNVNDIIKIGFSRHLNQRIKNLSSNTGPYCCALLATARGGREREMHYHRLFRQHRFSGEFFEPHAEILAEIERLVAATPLPSWAKDAGSARTVITRLSPVDAA